MPDAFLCCQPIHAGRCHASPGNPLLFGRKGEIPGFRPPQGLAPPLDRGLPRRGYPSPLAPLCKGSWQGRQALTEGLWASYRDWLTAAGCLLLHRAYNPSGSHSFATSPFDRGRFCGNAIAAPRPTKAPLLRGPREFHRFPASELPEIGRRHSPAGAARDLPSAARAAQCHREPVFPATDAV